jgi:hypothetical protein
MPSQHFLGDSLHLKIGARLSNSSSTFCIDSGSASMGNLDDHGYSN